MDRMFACKVFDRRIGGSQCFGVQFPIVQQGIVVSCDNQRGRKPGVVLGQQGGKVGVQDIFRLALVAFYEELHCPAGEGGTILEFVEGGGPQPAVGYRVDEDLACDPGSLPIP